ncbi:uncharacterized protein TRUGW13939_08819 [Talaromyces rugulosus]|uniref:GH64 domain-containing protein n=1 Tax=Talaromyces rugulosus TaxID=121627 RepID=A0A7H8R624_TALRU|nr:uncharacterized protein TRUGW13939_08819 [Talaromyces rugulosus]QKX61667.1 hypothetical protein TRUGW13939_08819 [Talaromyces rugulosus]
MEWKRLGVRISIWIVLQFGILTAGAAPQLSLSIVNNLPGDASVNAYITGLDSGNRLVLLQPDGTWYRPDAATQSSTPTRIATDVAIPLGPYRSVSVVDIPGYVTGGRIWFVVGTLTFSTVLDANGLVTLVEPSVTDPSNPNIGMQWGFIELTYSETDGLFANISYVDFVSLALGLSLQSADGSKQMARGLPAHAARLICDSLQMQARIDGQPWDQLCVMDAAGDVIRVLSPANYVSKQPTAFNDYYRDYVDQFWMTYSHGLLTLNTDNAAGVIECTVSDALLTCSGDNFGYSKPSTADIFGCSSGPFAIGDGDNEIHRAVVPILCAAFTRTTLLSDDGNIEPQLDSTSYYTTSPSNYYSKIVHDYEVDGKGYAFPYDDVGKGQAGLVSSTSPKLLTITVGGP